MLENVITIVIVVAAVAIALRYLWLEITNPCRHCTKECSRRKRGR